MSVPTLSGSEKDPFKIVAVLRQVVEKLNNVVAGAVGDGTITNAKLADMAQATIKGRAAAAGTGAPQDLTPAQTKTLLGLVTTTTDNAIIRADGTSGGTQNSGILVDDSNNLTLPNAAWLKGRNALDSADLSAFRVNSSNFTEFSNPIYYDDNSAFADRSAKLTIQRNTGSSAPSAILPSIYSLVETKGDNASQKGASAGYFDARDRSDVVEATKPVLHGLTVNVGPRLVRNNSPADDAVAIVVGNSGSAAATELIYIGHTVSGGGDDALAAIGIDAHTTDAAIYITGSHAYGLDFSRGAGATFSSAAIRIPNNVNIVGRNAAGSADVAVVKIAGDNAVNIGDGVIGVYSTHVLLSQPLLLPNTGLQVYDSDASHRLSIVPGSNLTAARTLTLTTGDAARTVTINGNPTLDDWFDQSVKTTASPTFASAILSGNISAAAWTTTGLRFRSVAATLTDTSSSGTVPNAYTNYLSADTVAASSATTYTNYYGAFFDRPVAGTNVTMTDRWGLGANTARITSGVASTSKTTGSLVVSGGVGVSGGMVANSHVVHSPVQSMFAFWKSGGAQAYLLGRSASADDAQNFFLYDSDSGFIMQVDSSRNITVPGGSFKSLHATAGIGYGTGAGGTVTQLTNKATGVTLNKVCGAITTNNASLAAGAEVSFTLTNSAIATGDMVFVQHSSAGTAGAYFAQCTLIASGSCTITVSNLSGGSLSEAIVLSFFVMKGATS